VEDRHRQSHGPKRGPSRAPRHASAGPSGDDGAEATAEAASRRGCTMRNRRGSAAQRGTSTVCLQNSGPHRRAERPHLTWRTRHRTRGTVLSVKGASHGRGRARQSRLPHEAFQPIRAPRGAPSRICGRSCPPRIFRHPVAGRAAHARPPGGQPLPMWRFPPEAGVYTPPRTHLHGAVRSDQRFGEGHPC
jgi:hypothetical protein